MMWALFCLSLSILCSLFVLFALYLVAQWVKYHGINAENVPKVPGCIPFFGNVHQFTQPNPGVGMINWFTQYGKCVQLTFFSRPVLLLSDADAAMKVFKNTGKVFERGPEYDQDVAALGSVLFALRGKQWRTRRKQLNPMFKMKMIESLLPFLVNTVLPRVHSILSTAATSKQEIDLDELMAHVTLDVICKFVLGEDINHVENSRHAQDLAVLPFFELADLEVRMGSLLGALWPLLPLPVRFRFFARRRATFKYLETLIDKRRVARKAKAPVVDSDVIEHMLSLGLPTPIIRDEIIGLLFAGHDTTAHSIAIAIYTAVKHPNVQAQIRQEAESVCSAAGQDEAAVMSNASALWKHRYAEAVFKETLRLYPPALAHCVTVREPFDLGVCKVPAGMGIWVNTVAINRDPEHWGSDAAQFIPSRHITTSRSTGSTSTATVTVASDDGAHGIRHRRTDAEATGDSQPPPATTFFPFLAGPHQCIGQHLARLEALVLLPYLSRHFQFTPRPGYKMELAHGVTMKPINGIPVFVNAL